MKSKRTPEKQVRKRAVQMVAELHELRRLSEIDKAETDRFRKELAQERETVRQAKLEIEGLRNNITGLVFAISCARDNAHGWATKAAWLESRSDKLFLAD